MASISIVMTAYKRHKQLEATLESIKMQTRKPDQIIVVEDGCDDGQTFAVCRNAVGQLPVEHVRRTHRPPVAYSNASIPKNIGIKKATGDILIIQCAEVKYTRPDDIANMIRPIEEDGNASSFAYCQALDDKGNFQEWYAGPERCAGWYLDFCQCVRRDKVLAIGGFDEGYIGYGFEDDDFAFRLQRSGIQYRWSPEVVVQHQWHPHFNEGMEETMSIRGRARYDSMKIGIEEQERNDLIIANRGLNWGDINS